MFEIFLTLLSLVSGLSEYSCGLISIWFRRFRTEHHINWILQECTLISCQNSLHVQAVAIARLSPKGQKNEKVEVTSYPAPQTS